jgi:hypothetical protein
MSPSSSRSTPLPPISVGLLILFAAGGVFHLIDEPPPGNELQSVAAAVSTDLPPAPTRQEGGAHARRWCDRSAA